MAHFCRTSLGPHGRCGGWVLGAPWALAPQQALSSRGGLRTAAARAPGCWAGPPRRLGARALGGLPGPHRQAVSTASRLLREEGRQARRYWRSRGAAGTEPVGAGSEAQVSSPFSGPRCGRRPRPLPLALLFWVTGSPGTCNLKMRTHAHIHARLFRLMCFLLGPRERRAGGG